MGTIENTPISTETTTQASSKKGALKGAVAAAAGIAVLLGGAGTFALWNAEGELGTGSTGTGTLNAEFGQVTWQDETPGKTNPVDDITAFKLVPGDKLVGTGTITVTAEGENIVVDPQISQEGAVPPELAQHLTIGVELTNSADEPVTQVTEGESVLTATTTIVYDTAGVNTEQGQEINLSDIKVNLQQVAPTDG